MTEGKKVDVQIEIDADLDTVWKALSEGEELKRWFPLDARVTPGVGGGVWMSFGEGASWESPIEIWEPKRHLRTVDRIPDAPFPIAVDYYLESSGGKTIVRLVHSGFAADAWDDEMDTLNAGWAAFLANLKHYIERHFGEPRELPHHRHSAVEMSREEAFTRVLRALGFADGVSLQPGERYSVTATSGDRIEGEVRVFKRPINLTATAENWNDGWMMVEIEPGKGKCRPAIWVSLYGEARSEAEAMRARIQELLKRAFA